MRVVVVIQARMASSRLPGKVLLPLDDRPMLAWVVHAARRVAQAHQVVVATTTQPEDDAVEQWCTAHGVPCYRGAALDVLDRYYRAAQAFEAQVVVRLTADCPFLDPGLIDELLDRFLQAVPPLDFAANRLPPPWGRSFPIGLDAEVMTAAALARAWREAREPHHREHVTPYFYERASVEALRFRPQGPRWRETATPTGFRVALWHADEDLGHWRWTVDTPEDLALARAVARALGPRAHHWRTLLAWLQAHPEVARLNQGVRHKTHRDIDARLG